MRVRLTDRFCTIVKATGPQTEYFDETTKGLALRVTPKGKAWTFHYTRNDKRARMPLGTYPATSLAAARTRAIEARTALEAGSDLAGAAQTSFQAIAKDYLARDGSKLRSHAARVSALQRLVYPAIGSMAIAEVRRTDIIRMLDGIEDTAGPVMADRVLAFIRRIMNWHATRSDDFRSPIVAGMARTIPTERARERTLTDEELRAIWSATGGAGSLRYAGSLRTGVALHEHLFQALHEHLPRGDPFHRYLRFLLLTATRRNEAADARTDEVVGSVWTIPAERYKTGAEHVVPLSKAAMVLIHRDPHTDNAYVGVSHLFGPQPIRSFARHKAALDAASGTSGWTLHDLRRTARSLMSRAGVSADIAERCLGHVIPGVRGVYDRHEYLEEKRAAFEALATLVEGITRPSKC
jgi:integrase